MSCTICTKSFGFFNKEHGCPVCKYSFCSRCLKYRLVRDGKKLTVCLRCSKLSTTVTQTPEVSQSPAPVRPETVLETAPSLPLQNRTEVPYPDKPEQDPPSTNNDELIRSKLDALKAKHPNETASEGTAGSDGGSNLAGANDNIDIEKRLAALKGVEYRDYSNAAQRFLAPDNRTEEEQISDLMGRYANESKLDSAIESQRREQDEDILRRLKALKEFPTEGTAPGGSGSSRPKIPDSDSDDSVVDDEELARQLAQRYAEEGRLEAKLPPADSDEEILSDTRGARAGAGRKTSGPSANEDGEEELPWCTICNEDAVLRCRGCENDLYCNACFKEFHYDEDPREHSTVAFKPKGRKHR